MLKSSASSQDSSSHHSSNAPVITEKNRDFYVRSHVDYETHELRIEINPDYRPKTSFGDQGDHSTSYVSILQVLLASTNTFGLRQAIEKITSIASEFNETDNGFEDLPTLPDVMSHADRKDCAKYIKGTGDGQRSNLSEKADKTLQYAKKAALAQHLADLTSHVLACLQQQNLTTFYSKGRKNKIENEGNLVKKSLRALYALDELSRLVEVNKSSEEGINEYINGIAKSLNTRQSEEPEDDHLMRYGLNAWFQDNGNKADNLRNTLLGNDKNAKIKAIDDLKNELANKTTEMATYIGNLLDYRRVLVFDEKTAFPLNDADKEQIEENKITEVECIDNKVQELFNFNSDDYSSNRIVTNGTIEITRKNLSTLAQIVNRHEKIITLAFPNMNSLLKSSNKLEEVVVRFLEISVLGEQGWKDHKVGMEKKELSVTILKEEIISLENKSRISPGVSKL